MFGWLLNISFTGCIVTWALIGVCYIRFLGILKTQGIDRVALPYQAPLQLFLFWYSLFFNTLIVITSGCTVFIEWDTSDFFSYYGSLMLWLVLYIAYKVIVRKCVAPLVEADLNISRDTGLDGESELFGYKRLLRRFCSCLAVSVCMNSANPRVTSVCGGFHAILVNIYLRGVWMWAASGLFDYGRGHCKARTMTLFQH